MATRKVAEKKTPVRKQKVELNLPNLNDCSHDGEYFHAIVKGKRIAGEIENLGDDEMILHNQQGVGDENECSGDEQFGHGIYINPNCRIENGEYVDGEYDWEAEFIKEGITEFTIVKDRRLIKIIEGTKLASFANSWAVRLNEDGEVSFGCGAVSLTLDDIKNFIYDKPKYDRKEEIEREIEDLEDEMKDIEDELENSGFTSIVKDIEEHMYIEDIDMDEVEKLYDKVEKLQNLDIDDAVKTIKVAPRKIAARKR